MGDGGDMPRVKALAGPNVEVLGHQPTAVLRDLMQRARAFVFAAEEDFGIAPVEAQACGTPIIAYGRGGALETVRGGDHPEPTGSFFHAQTPAAIADGVLQFEREGERCAPRACRENALRFSVDVFRERYSRFVLGCWEAFRARRSPPSRRAEPRFESHSARARAHG